MSDPTLLLPERYTTPELILFGELRQMIRGSGSPTRADFSSLDTDPATSPNICLGSPASDGNDLFDDDCDNFFPF